MTRELRIIVLQEAAKFLSGQWEEWTKATK